MITRQRVGKDFDAPQPVGFGHGMEKRLIVVIADKRRPALPDPGSSPGHVGEQVEKSLASLVFDEDTTAGLATVHDVVVRAGVSIRRGLAMPAFYFILDLRVNS
jgi:hypothetical protein